MYRLRGKADFEYASLRNSLDKLLQLPSEAVEGSTEDEDFEFIFYLDDQAKREEQSLSTVEAMTKARERRLFLTQNLFPKPWNLISEDDGSGEPHAFESFLARCNFLSVPTNSSPIRS